MKTFNKIVAAVVVATSTVIAPMAFASEVGDTTLTAEACTDLVAIRVYDIDFGSFTATDVLGAADVDRAGTKNGAGQSGATQSTPTAPSGGADYYVEIDNPCYVVGTSGWTVDVQVSDMTDQNSVIPGTTGTPIAGSNHRLDADGTLYYFQNSPTNTAMTANSAVTDQAYDTAHLLVTHDGTDNGIAGYYGVNLTHEMDIPADQSVDEYKGTITVTYTE